MSGPRVAHLTTVHRLRDPRIFYKAVGTLRDAGYDVHLVARHARSETVEGVPVTALEAPEGRLTAPQRLVLLRQAYAEARALDAALYHVHDPELIPVAYALKRATGARVVYDMHEDYRWHGRLLGPGLRALERWCFRWVDHVVVVHDGLRRLVEAHGAPATVVANYFLPHDPSAPPTAKRLAGPLRLLYAGVQAEVRGLPTLVDVAGRIAAGGLPWRLDLVGVCYRADERARAEDRLAAYGGADVLHRTGWADYVPHVAMMPFYAQAHVGLALWEPHPNHAAVPTKFYEYLHHGLPIVCTDLPAWRPFIERHGCGALVPPGDAGAVVRVVQGWADDPERYAALSAAAAETAPQYHWRVMGERLAALYDALLGR